MVNEALIHHSAFESSQTTIRYNLKNDRHKPSPSRFFRPITHDDPTVHLDLRLTMRDRVPG
jgi:hypothetical protein